MPFLANIVIGKMSMLTFDVVPIGVFIELLPLKTFGPG